MSKAIGDEIERSTQGVPERVCGTNTILFIRQGYVPVERFKGVTYRVTVCELQRRNGGSKQAGRG